MGGEDEEQREEEEEEEEGGGGDRSVSWNVNEISLYLLFPLASTLTPLTKRTRFSGV